MIHEPPRVGHATNGVAMALDLGTWNECHVPGWSDVGADDHEPREGTSSDEATRWVRVVEVGHIDPRRAILPTAVEETLLAVAQEAQSHPHRRDRSAVQGSGDAQASPLSWCSTMADAWRGGCPGSFSGVSGTGVSGTGSVELQWASRWLNLRRYTVATRVNDGRRREALSVKHLRSH